MEINNVSFLTSDFIEKVRIAQESDESLRGKWEEARSTAADYRIKQGILCTTAD